MNLSALITKVIPVQLIYLFNALRPAVFPGAHITSPPFDLSRVTNLKDLELQWHKPYVQWITMSLQTAKSQNLCRITITIDLSTAFDLPTEGEIHREWQDLDHLLAQLWTSRSILPKIKYKRAIRGNTLGELPPGLLPELTIMGAISMVG